jgi:hypothetical protein
LSPKESLSPQLFLIQRPVTKDAVPDRVVVVPLLSLLVGRDGGSAEKNKPQTHTRKTQTKEIYAEGDTKKKKTLERFFFMTVGKLVSLFLGNTPTKLSINIFKKSYFMLNNFPKY